MSSHSNNNNNVRLRCYDLSQGMAAQFAPMFGLQLEAIWHTGIEFQGTEYFFSGGIQMMPPQQVERTFGLRPTKVLDLGETTKTKQQLESFLRSIHPRFTAATYDLFNHNCNHFTDEVAKFLLGRGIPEDIVELPQRVLNSPIGQMIRPMMENMEGRFGESTDPFAAMQNTGNQQPPPNTASSSSSMNANLSNTHATAGSASSTYRTISIDHIREEVKKPIVCHKLDKMNDLLGTLRHEGIADAEASILQRNLDRFQNVDGTDLNNNHEFPDLASLADTLCSVHEKFVQEEKWTAVAIVLMLTRNLLLYFSGADVILDGDRPTQLYFTHLNRHKEKGTGEQLISIVLSNMVNALVTPQGKKVLLEESSLNALHSHLFRVLPSTGLLCRRMAASVLFNLCISLQEALAGDGKANDSLREACTVILCGITEILPQETDPVVIYRWFLSLVCLLQTKDDTVKELFNSLGLRDVLTGVTDNLARIVPKDASNAWDPRELSDQIRAAHSLVEQLATNV